MPIDPTADTLISLAEAAKSLPKRPSPASLWRWHSRGVRGGIRLETVVVGGRRYTTAAAWREFAKQLSADATKNRPKSSRPRSEQLQKQLRAARLI